MSSTEDEVEDIDEEYLYDEEYEEEEEEAEEEDLESIYDPEDFINYPFLSENSTISPDILEFDFLYGYNCRKYYNLAVPSPETIVFSSGNFLVVFDVEKKRISELKRSALGGGIGHVVTNPNPEFSHLSVAYNGNDPIIIIYEWPSMEINCVLRNGSTKTFTNMCYSPDGMLLASQSGDPDYLITIFNWPKHRILLRTKSNVNDVHHVRFSPYVPGQLTTAGIAHIKFWKMCETFTGLKLKGDLGRFGKTEYSDILGILPMPDEKVVSGSSWGNLLVWDAGLIKIEVMRTLRRKLHEGPITQIEYTEGELWTVSMDGHIKVWWYEKIEQADPPDDDRVIQLEPSYDFYTPGVMLMCVKKKNSEPTDTWHYAQDGNGGIWSIDLTVDEKPRDSVLLYKCHAGPIVDVATSPKYEYVATLGQDGRLYVYNYNRRIMVFNYEFPAKGACMEWLNATVRETGDELILAFDDGNVRVCVLEMDHTDGTIQKLTVVQIIKPHNKPIKVMSVNKSGSLLVTGAEDKTIFVFALVNTQNVETLLLQPIGFIPTPSVPTCMTWHPQIDYIILVGCREGYFFEATLPLAPQNYTGVSFKLKVVPRLKRFTTYKAQIRRDIKIAEIEARKAKKVERKRTEMMKIKEENPGLEIDEDVFLADSESEEELEPLHIPDVPNDILWIQYTSEHTLWLSLKGPIGRPPPPPKPKVIKKAKQKDDIEFFLLNLSQVAVNNKMDPKLIRLLYKYRQRKAKWEQRQDEWEEFKAREPPIGVNHPDDIKDLTQALDTIGDYKLKTSPDYKVPKHLRESTLKKYKQLLESTKQLFAMRHNFSRKVYAIRARKMEVRNALKEDAEKLAKIHAELPKNLIREGPANPPIEDSEYPEKNLMTRIAAKVPNTLSIATDFLPQEENIIFVEAPDADQAEKEVLVIQDMESNCQDIFKDSKLCEQIKGVCVYDMDQLMEESRKDVTLWELEVRGFRLNRKLFEQQEIIQNMQDLIEEFDDELEKLTRERCEVSVDALFLDIFLNSLHQELVILKDFESVEEDLSDKLNQRQTQVLDMQDMIDSIKMQIEAQSASIEKLQDQGKIIQDTFNKSIHDNKFQDFLRRVFKKKYKPPKGARGDESSSESSSSSSSDESDEDEAKSIDSRDFGIIKQDLNVCPKGCDPDIYNLTISLRTQRHSLEMAVKECQRQIEVLKKDMEICFKKLKIMNNNLKQSTEELEAFQREKQQKLNEVLCTIVLHLSQMQHIKPPENYNCNIKDTLVFSKTMLSRLYRRVGELEAETLRQQSKHKINVKHLSRMKTDCNYMEREVRKLQTEIKNLTFIKFGKNISIMEVEEMMLKRTFGDDVINTLQEAVLKKLIHNLRLNLLDIKSMYIQEIKNLNEKIVTTGKELTQTYKVNTGKLELLSLLKKERCELSIEISRQDERREHMNSKNDIATQYKNELDKFTNIIKDQRQEIAELKAEIKMLRTKGLPPKEVILDEVPKRVRPKKSADQKVASAGEDSSAEMMEPPPPDKGPKKLEKITIPTESLFERQKSEQIVHDALDDLLEKLDIQLSQVSTKSFIMSILNKVVNKVSMEALVEEIIDNLPILPTDEQKSIIEETADKLLTEEEMMEELEEEEKMLYFKTIFDDILEDVYEECIAEPHVFIMKIMLRLVDEILIEDLMKSRSLVEKIIDELLDNIDLTKLNMVKMKESLDSLMDDTLKEFLGEVIRRVFSRGTDYIYWHDL